MPARRKTGEISISSSAVSAPKSGLPTGSASARVSEVRTTPVSRLASIAASTWARPIVLALDQGAAEALEGEDHGQRHEDQRHHRLAEARGGDQAGQHDGGGEGDHFDADAGSGRPAHAGDGGILELLG